MTPRISALILSCFCLVLFGFTLLNYASDVAMVIGVGCLVVAGVGVIFTLKKVTK